MTTHILAKSLAGLEDKGAELRDTIETKFSDLRTAISNGNRKAMETITDELHGLVVTSQSLLTAAHDHAKALMPAPHVDRAEPVATETTVGAAKKR
jgi:hypothetical protein